jgi:cobalt-zinc-cadmium efflux system membrane fusion protein
MRKLAQQTYKRQKGLAEVGAFTQPSLQSAQNQVATASTELASAQSTLQQASAEVSYNISVLERNRTLFNLGLIPKKDLDASELQLKQSMVKVEQARENVRQAQKVLENAQKALEREKQIYQQNYLGRKELEMAESELRKAQIDVKSTQKEWMVAQKRLQAAGLRLQAIRVFPGQTNHVDVVAPFAGVIASREVSKGEFVDSNKTLLTVLDTSIISLEADIFEPDLSKIKQGQEMEITSEAFPGKVLRGRIASLDRVVNPQTKTIKARLNIENPEGLLRANQFVKVFIMTDKKLDVLSVPLVALQEVGGMPVVFVERRDGYEKREVKLGAKTLQKVQILEGLQEGEHVVTTGSLQIKTMILTR